MIELGKVAYDAYSQQCGGKGSISGAVLPQWHQLSDALRKAWNVAAEAVIAEVTE